MYFAIFEMNECFFLPSDGTMMHCARRRRGMVSMAQLFVMELLASSSWKATAVVDLVALNFHRRSAQASSFFPVSLLLWG